MCPSANERNVRPVNRGPSEQFGLTSSPRAAVSVPANIAEGHGRTSDREFKHHLSIAYGSLCELETLITLALLRNYIDAPGRPLQDACGEVAD